MRLLNTGSLVLSDADIESRRFPDNQAWDNVRQLEPLVNEGESQLKRAKRNIWLFLATLSLVNRFEQAHISILSR
jgi:hypothetical protein